VQHRAHPVRARRSSISGTRQFLPFVISLRPVQFDCAVDQHRNGGMGQDLDGLAAQNQSRDAAPAVRGHRDQVAAMLLGLADDGAIGLV
jgi:hypothetical protein